jgi:hypothetical protein
MRGLVKVTRGAKIVGPETREFETISALSPAHVAGYLRGRGWRDQGKYGSYGQLYSKNVSDRAFNVVLPRLATIADFAARMKELINVVAEVEDRGAAGVLFDLTLAPFDVIRVRSMDADAYGSIRFAQGLDLYEEAKRAVVAAANAAACEQPRKAWKGRRPDSVGQYLERALRLGQTENASFSLTVLSSYSFDPEGQEKATLFDDQAFGRRVTLKFGSALTAIETALGEAVTGDPLAAFEKGIAAGVSADMCQALANLAENESGIQVSVTWTPAKPAGNPIRLSLTRQDSAVLHEVARTFARQEPEPEFILEGLVEEIREKPERFDGSVVIQAKLPQQVGVRKIRVRFAERDREFVYEAAKNRRWVRVTGSLAREGKVLKLDEPHDFSIVEPSDES